MAVVETDRLLQLTGHWESPVSISKLPRMAGHQLQEWCGQGLAYVS